MDEPTKDVQITTGTLEFAACDAQPDNRTRFAVKLKGRGYVNLPGEGAMRPDISYEEQYAGFRDQDGDKVYVKTVVIDSFPSAGSAAVFKTVPTGIANFKKVRDFRVIWGDSADSYEGSLTGIANTARIVSILADGNISIYVVNLGNGSIYSGEATIWYTCTDR